MAEKGGTNKIELNYNDPEYIEDVKKILLFDFST